MRYDNGDDGNNMCVFCKRGTVLFSGDAVLCKHHGLVKPTAKCRRFKYDPLKRDIKPLPPIPKLFFEPEE